MFLLERLCNSTVLATAVVALYLDGVAQFLDLFLRKDAEPMYDGSVKRLAYVLQVEARVGPAGLSPGVMAVTTSPTVRPHLYALEWQRSSASSL